MKKNTVRGVQAFVRAGEEPVSALPGKPPRPAASFRLQKIKDFAGSYHPIRNCRTGVTVSAAKRYLALSVEFVRVADSAVVGIVTLHVS
jgi:hypothetical protein